MRFSDFRALSRRDWMVTAAGGVLIVLVTMAAVWGRGRADLGTVSIMASYSLRPARETDAAAIQDLIHSAGINPMALDWKRFVVAVEARDRVVATGQIKPHGAKTRVHELASIAVVPEYRGQGIARAIIEHLLKDSPRPLYLTCLSGLEPLYAKFGFQTIPYEEMPRYFQRISKLAGLVFHLASRGERLLVMKLQ